MNYDYLVGDLVMQGSSPYEFGVILEVYEASGDLALRVKWNDQIQVCSVWRVTPVKSIDGYS